MQNERSGARAHRTRQGEEVLSPLEAEARDRGRDLKRYIRAAAALRGLYDDTAIGAAVEVNRGAVSRWWDGAQMKPETMQRLADATGLKFEDIARFVYFGDRPPDLPEASSLPGASGPAGLREGARRAETHPDVAAPGMPARSPVRPPRDDGAGRG